MRLLLFIHHYYLLLICCEYILQSSYSWFLFEHTGTDILKTVSDLAQFKRIKGYPQNLYNFLEQYNENLLKCVGAISLSMTISMQPFQQISPHYDIFM